MTPSPNNYFNCWNNSTSLIIDTSGQLWYVMRYRGRKVLGLLHMKFKCIGNKRSWFLAVHQHGKKETSWENIEISVKNLSDQGNLGLGETAKKLWKMRKGKSFCCSHTILLHMKTVDLITPQICSLKSIEEDSFVSWNTFWFCRQIMYFLNRSNPTSNLFVAAFCLLIHWSIIPLTGLFCFVLFISEEFITLFKLNAWRWLVGFFSPETIFCLLKVIF